EAERQYEEHQKAVGVRTRQVLIDKLGKFRGAVVYPVGEKNKEGKLVQVAKTTAGWDNTRDVTVVQRRKEEASDYRYFPEPDLVPVEVGDAWLERVRAAIGELPAAQRRRLLEQYGLSAYDAEVIARQGRPFVAYFEEVARLTG